MLNDLFWKADMSMLTHYHTHSFLSRKVLHKECKITIGNKGLRGDVYYSSPLTHSYICAPYPGGHPHTRSSNTLSPTKTPLSPHNTTNYPSDSQSDMHAHTCAHFSESMVFQWGVSLGWCWSGWWFCLKTSIRVTAGNQRRRSSKAGRAKHGWVSRRSFTVVSVR